jgi:hypothetical protein
MSSFVGHFFSMIFNPWRACARLMQDRKPLWRGLQIIITTGCLIAVTAGALAVTGGIPMAPVTWPLAPENYYFWEMLFILPSLVVLWIFISGLVQVLGRGGRRGGAARKTLGLLGFAIAGPLILAWIPQLVIAVFYVLGMGQQEMVDILSEPGPWQTVFLAFPLAAALGSVVLSVAAVTVSQKVRWWKGIPMGILASAVLILACIAFLR